MITTFDGWIVPAAVINSGKYLPSLLAASTTAL
jgi:hypothetical protein